MNSSVFNKWEEKTADMYTAGTVLSINLHIIMSPYTKLLCYKHVLVNYNRVNDSIEELVQRS